MNTLYNVQKTKKNFLMSINSIRWLDLPLDNLCYFKIIHSKTNQIKRKIISLKTFKRIVLLGSFIFFGFYIYKTYKYYFNKTISDEKVKEVKELAKDMAIIDWKSVLISMILILMGWKYKNIKKLLKFKKNKPFQEPVKKKNLVEYEFGGLDGLLGKGIFNRFFLWLFNN